MDKLDLYDIAGTLTITHRAARAADAQGQDALKRLALMTLDRYYPGWAIRVTSVQPNDEGYLAEYVVENPSTVEFFGG